MSECGSSLDGKHHFATRPSGTDPKTGRVTDSHLICVCGLKPQTDEQVKAINDALRETAEMRSVRWGVEQGATKPRLPL